MLILWTAVPLLFFSLSTRQEYYVLPSLPALAMLLAGWLRLDTAADPLAPTPLRVQSSPREPALHGHPADARQIFAVASVLLPRPRPRHTAPSPTSPLSCNKTQATTP